MSINALNMRVSVSQITSPSVFKYNLNKRDIIIIIVTFNQNEFIDDTEKCVERRVVCDINLLKNTNCQQEC